MKIAFVRTASSPLRIGSYNIQELGLAKALLKHQISSDFFACFSNVKTSFVWTEQNGARIEVHPLRGYAVYKEMVFYPYLYRSLKRGGYAVVLLEDDSQPMLPYLFKRLRALGVRTVLWQGMYRSFDNKLAALLQKAYDCVFKNWIIRNADVKLAKTEYARKYLEGKGYRDVGLLKVGLDAVETTEDARLEKLVDAFCVARSKTLLYVGVIDHRRDVLFLLSLLKTLKDQGVGLIIVGKGKGLSEAEEYMAEHELEEAVLLIEHLENSKLHLVFSRADIFLLPTRYEIYGMVVLEALSFGLPVISGREAGPLSILSDRELGLCEDLVADKWLAALDFYFSHFNAEVNKNNRRALVAQVYNWPAIGDVFLAYIS